MGVVPIRDEKWMSVVGKYADKEKWNLDLVGELTFGSSIEELSSMADDGLISTAAAGVLMQTMVAPGI